MRSGEKRKWRFSPYVLYKETLSHSREYLWSFLGAFAGIGAIAFLQEHYLDATGNVLLIGSFGASAVLIYGAIQSPLAQPRNLIGGHLISAIIGVSVQQYFPDLLWLKAPSAVALSIVAMQFSQTLHPPGGATALIAVSGTPSIKALGYMYVLTPVLSGALILLLFALLFNNLTEHRKYPTNSRYTRHIRKLLRTKE